MSWWHRHQWSIKFAAYTGTIVGADKPGYYHDDGMLKIAQFGLTTVALACERCGKFRTVEMYGKPIDKALADLVIGPGPETP